MSVNPGFGGQGFIPAMLAKIDQARRLIDASGRDIRLEVDGGIKVDNIRKVADAGADTFVAGSAIFGQPSYKTVIEAMRAELRARAISPRRAAPKRAELPSPDDAAGVLGLSSSFSPGPLPRGLSSPRGATPQASWGRHPLEQLLGNEQPEDDVVKAQPARSIRARRRARSLSRRRS